MRIAEFLPEQRTPLWDLALQTGVNYAVSRLPAPVTGLPSVEGTRPSYDFMNLLWMKERFNDSGLKLEVIEPGLDMWNVKAGREGRDLEIEQTIILIRNMAALDIPVLCYSSMAEFRWLRTSLAMPTRGGALVSGYDHDVMRNAPPMPESLSEEEMWDNLKYFLERVVPVAEECKVKLAIHPDDPPVSSIRGIARIIRSAEAMQRVIDLVPSDYNGITMCQGTLAAAGEDIPALVRHFGAQKKIFFAHFRDVRGSAERFHETFHDDGMTDMYAVIKAYKEVGFDGPIRVDHVPTMVGESNNDPGYEGLGRLFAIGYLKGLIEAAGKEA
jgi:mannonate dehydratase